MAALAVVVVLGAAAYYDATGGHPFANIPPTGAIWFGMGFDPESFEVRDQLTSVGPDATFYMVGRLPRSMAGTRLVIREYVDDVLITIAWSRSTEEMDTWAFSIGPMMRPGTWRFEIAEMGGGEVLASGQFVATE